MTADTLVVEAFERTVLDLPPVCEFADSPEIVWRDPKDQPCGGSGSWLLIYEKDPPSPLCDKHAAITGERLNPLPPGYRMVLA